MTVEIGLLASKVNTLEKATERQMAANALLLAEFASLSEHCDAETQKLAKKRRKLKEEHKELTNEGAQLQQKLEQLEAEVARMNQVPLRRIIDANL